MTASPHDRQARIEAAAVPARRSRSAAGSQASKRQLPPALYRRSGFRRSAAMFRPCPGMGIDAKP